MGLWNFTPVSIIYFISIGISLLLSFFAWRMRPADGSAHFSLMMLFLSIWVAVSMLCVFSLDFEFKLFMLKLEYLSMAVSVYLWVLFISYYTQYYRWLKNWVLVLLSIIPIVTIINIFQAPNNNYIHESYKLVQVNGLTIFAKNYTVGFYIWAAYVYLMLGFGVTLIIFRIITSPLSKRKQLVYIIPTIVVVILPNVIFITDNNPIEPYDPTPLSLVVVGIIFLYTIYFHKFLNVVPVAHELIFRNVKSGIIIVDERNFITELNPIAEAIIGKRSKKALGKHILAFLPECDIFCSTENDSEFKTEISIGPGKRIFEVKVAPLIDYSGSNRGQVIMLWDITEQKIALNELDAYARTVAHDLKNPLGLIMGFAKLIESGVIPPDEIEENIKYIISGGEKMRNIVDGLLMLAKIRNQDAIELSVVDMSVVMLSVHARTKEMVELSNATIIYPKIWHNATGNSIWLEEVWINLISNATKYGGQPPYIELGSEIIGNNVRYWVRDNGLGMTEKEISQLFIEFTRVHPNKDSIQGHGLGLSIVERIIKKLGGEIGVESEPGIGSCFYLILPRA